jgi:hypothetical protein
MKKFLFFFILLNVLGNINCKYKLNKKNIDMNNFNEKNNNYLYLITVSTPKQFKKYSKNEKNSAIEMWENIFYGAFDEIEKINAENSKQNKFNKNNESTNIKIFCPALGQGIFEVEQKPFLLSMIEAFNLFQYKP